MYAVIIARHGVWLTDTREYLTIRFRIFDDKSPLSDDDSLLGLIMATRRSAFTSFPRAFVSCRVCGCFKAKHRESRQILGLAVHQLTILMPGRFAGHTEPPPSYPIPDALRQANASGLQSVALRLRSAPTFASHTPMTPPATSNSTEMPSELRPGVKRW
jgi:hypothetical protein